MMGPINGEINIAPMITAVELTLRPMEAIKMLKTKIQRLNPRNPVSRVQCPPWWLRAWPNRRSQPFQDVGTQKIEGGLPPRTEPWRSKGWSVSRNWRCSCWQQLGSPANLQAPNKITTIMRIAYAPCYVLDLPEGHRFPMAKYGLLREQLLHEGIAETGDFFEPQSMAESTILRAHDADYWHRTVHGQWTRREERVYGGFLGRQAWTRVSESSCKARWTVRSMP